MTDLRFVPWGAKKRHSGLAKQEVEERSELATAKELARVNMQAHKPTLNCEERRALRLRTALKAAADFIDAETGDIWCAG